MDWNRLLSRIRLGLSRQHPDSEARTDFQRDFDRIVFSSAFRRLQDKTQVFPLSQSDYVRTRLTHSLEVSSVGRSLGTMVGDSVIKRHDLKGVYPQDFGAVVAAACLAHDIGNPPFGHAGEDAIRFWFTASATGRVVLGQLTEVQRQDFLRFEGNAQGFRIITRLQSPDNPGGMQLTCATLGTFTKYPCAASLPTDPLPGIAFKKFGFYQDDQDLFAEVAGQLELESVAPGAWSRHPLAWLVEAADDICYRIIDVEDAFRLQQLRYEEVRDLLLPLTGEADRAQRKLAHVTRPKERIEYLRAKAIGAIIEQAHQCFMENEDTILAGGLNEELLDAIPAAGAMRALKDCGESQVYVSRPVVEVEAAGFEVLGGLLEAFITTINDIAANGSSASPKSRMLIHLIPEQFAGPGRYPVADLYRRVLAITDFVSGMTDSYAVALFKKLTGISLPTG
ncbi:deoxyguanosinetriphosphate triphosphohydrolase [Candidatus Contendibacter odensensis]|uniref:Deoxyguanosinetriphosphate triphosphohydrolase-like protein n=1 Tax=Candidatus Contendobacter odensis Run_B_J11 TaxID=1400861 RepID=A0A7U7GEC3_9GAMM|nr:deoxyguanosinetriphosphate triphosphohydrolase [Candidatus Contendobacter odensis]CDH46704.1 Deoxyguanosinetriphosphate triphosphohydrolase-like protein [Candidatus Contendobacter odensis Run_B_J11]